MSKLNSVTTLTRSTGSTNPIPFRATQANCSINQSCLVELTGHPGYCYQSEPACPIKLEALFKTLKRCGIHQRFLSSSFEEIEEIGVPENLQNQYHQIKAYTAHLEENIEAGNGLLLKGAVGTMKTTLAVAVLREFINLGGEGLFLTMSGLLDNLFTLKARSMNQWAKFEQQIRDTPLLVLDDLGAEHTEGWVLTKVDSIIAERYNRCRSIIITTNLSTAQLRGVYAERVIDRLRSTLEIINFSGPSQRLSAFASVRD